ncbi:amidohydrolase family protein [uncultured Winogradskyella sp.]|uniref:amidohydrolase family protein n=1 Tax=uncultured Winogradskyella sp. TaxID=395353 RepID=UPI0026122BCE|nr:amidohydrolase family protein [uncultured Winogradskyella sp.]
MSTYKSWPITLVGNVVTDSIGTYQMMSLTLETGNGKNGTILELTPGTSSKNYPSAPVYNLSPSQIIFPGLINLHNHLDWDFFPLWYPSLGNIWGYDNRFEWQANSSYQTNIRNVHGQIEKKLPTVTYPGSPDGYTLLTALSEIQSVCGGTTIIQENTSIDYSTKKVTNHHILIRNTGDTDDMQTSPKFIDSAVMFYRPTPPTGGIPGSPGHDTSTWVPPLVQSSLTDWQGYIANNDIQSALVHLSEGRYGYLNKGTKDAYTRQEFLAFKNLVTSSYTPAAFKNTRFNMIHACGIDPTDASDISFIQNYGITVLWSPVSNTMLYGDTLDIKTLVNKGVPIVLTSDWSPSGSKHVWDESKYAYEFLTSIQGYSDTQAKQMLYGMMTSNAAKCIGKDNVCGKIVQGGWADLFILNAKNPVSSYANALDILFESDDSQTSGVYTGGMLVLADTTNFTPPGLSLDFQNLPASDGPYAANKAINFNANGDYPNIQLGKVVLALDTLLAGCTPPVVRSKFLVSDDKPYQAYISSLHTWLSKQTT